MKIITKINTCVTLLALSMSTISVANIRISPLKVELKKQTKKMDSLTLFNKVDKVKHFQVTVLKKKSDGIYERSRDVIAVPTVFKVQPKKEQLVRVALRSENEQSIDRGEYRVAIKELPQGRVKPGQVRLITEMNVPINIED